MCIAWGCPLPHIRKGSCRNGGLWGREEVCARAMMWMRVDVTVAHRESWMWIDVEVDGRACRLVFLSVSGGIGASLDSL